MESLFKDTPVLKTLFCTVVETSATERTAAQLRVGIEVRGGIGTKWNILHGNMHVFVLAKN